MIVKLKGNNAELGDVVAMVIDERIVLVDKEDYERLRGYTWHIRRVHSQYYAYRIVKSKWGDFKVWMHRQIMHTPTSKVVHHKNRCGLDNRKENLQNMPKKEHHLIHGFC